MWRRWRTGLADEDAVGDSGAQLVVSGALIDALVRLGPLSSADVHHQRPWARLHQDFRVLIDVKMHPVLGPREAEGEEKARREFILSDT